MVVRPRRRHGPIGVDCVIRICRRVPLVDDPTPVDGRLFSRRRQTVDFARAADSPARARAPTSRDGPGRRRRSARPTPMVHLPRFGDSARRRLQDDTMADAAADGQAKPSRGARRPQTKRAPASASAATWRPGVAPTEATPSAADDEPTRNSTPIGGRDGDDDVIAQRRRCSRRLPDWKRADADQMPAAVVFFCFVFRSAVLARIRRTCSRVRRRPCFG